MAGRRPFDLALPVAPEPVGSYERGMIRNGIGFLSGQFPIIDGKLKFEGRVGAELSEAQACEAAEIAALNCLAQIEILISGDWDRFAGLYRLDGYVASVENYFRQPSILNTASDLFLRTLGDSGRHARSAFSVARLPLNSPVELVLSFAMRSA